MRLALLIVIAVCLPQALAAALPEEVARIAPPLPPERGAAPFAASLPLDDGSPGDCGSGRDAGSGPDLHVEVALPASCDGSFARSDRDEYGFEVDAGHVVIAEASRPAGSFGLHVIDGDRDLIASSYGDIIAARVHTPRAYVALAEQDGTPGSYHVDIRSEPFADTPDCALPGDAPDVSSTSPPLAPLPSEGSCTGRIDVGDGTDVYLLQNDGAAVARVDLHVLTPGRSVVLYAYDKEGRFLDVPLVDAEGRASFATQERGNVTVIVWPFDGRPLDAIDYTLTLTRSPIPPADDCGLGLDLPATLGGPLLSPACLGAFGPGDLTEGFSLPPPSGPSKLVLDVQVDAPFYLSVPRDGEILSAYDFGGATASRTGTLYLDGASPDPLRGVMLRFGYVTTGPREGPWSISWRYEADDQDDCGAGRDAPGDATRALPLDAPVVRCGAALRDGDRRDAYRLPAEPDDLVVARILGGRALDHVQWEDDATGLGGLAWGPNVSFAMQVQGPLAFTVAGEPSTYEMAVDRVASSSLDDCGAGREASPTRPVPLALPASCGGELTNAADRVDAYTVVARRGEVLVIVAKADDILTLQCAGPQGIAATRRVLLAGEEARGVCVVDQDGTWHVRVQNGSAAPSVPYTLDVRAVPGLR